MELSAALIARAVALTLVGQSDESRATVERASIVDEIETVLERADLLDSFLNPEAAKSILDALAERPEANARLLFNLQCAWFYGRRGWIRKRGHRPRDSRNRSNFSSQGKRPSLF